MFTHDHHKRIRYGETDQMGYLYYGNLIILLQGPMHHKIVKCLIK